MASARQTPGVVRFGVFEVDLRAGELRKDGLKVRLQEQPFRVLALLIDKPGEVVTREEVREKLWSADTYVDFDKSLNTTVNKLREALGDSAENPRFVQTLHRRGYRFIAPVQAIASESSAVGQTPPPPVGTGTPAGPSPGSGNLTSAARSGLGEETLAGPSTVADPAGVQQAGKPASGWRLWAAGVAALAVGLGLGFFLGEGDVSPNNLPLRKFQLAIEGSGVFGSGIRPAISPDGTMVAYWRLNTLWIRDLDQVEPRELPGTEEAWGPFWSPDSKFVGYASGATLKKVSAQGGPSSTICEIPAMGYFAGTWGTEGAIVYATVAGMFEVPTQGGEPRLLAKPDPEQAEQNLLFPQFFPDGQTLLFGVDKTGDGGQEIMTLSGGEQKKGPIDAGERLPPAHILSFGTHSLLPSLLQPGDLGSPLFSRLPDTHGGPLSGGRGRPLPHSLLRWNVGL
jgi:DNA-binding winged helix-turn-helix (wHTH) protein